MNPVAHDMFVMIATAFGIFFGIRLDLKGLHSQIIELEKRFTDHMTKYHKGD